jgi:hypothetical protein
MTITQEWIIKYVIHDVIGYIMDDTGATLVEAMDKFYISEVCKKLYDIETGLYSESAGYVYDLYKSERKHGFMTQWEDVEVL